MIISFFLLLLTPAKISLGWVYDKIGPKFGTIYVMGFFAIALAMLLITNSTTPHVGHGHLYSIGILQRHCHAACRHGRDLQLKYFGEIYGFMG